MQAHPLIAPLIERLTELTGAPWEYVEPWDISLTVEISGRTFRYTYPVSLMRLDNDPEAYAVMVAEDSKRKILGDSLRIESGKISREEQP